MGTRLSALDLAFLALETQKSPVNIGGLGVFQLPKGKPASFVREVRDALMEQTAGPPFDQKLSGGVVSLPEWIKDPDFDLSYHVRHSALPKPGSMEDLLELVSRLHSRVMDRERPLWECHLIEGLRRRRFAIYVKFHHAAIDGVGGIQILESCFSEDPEAPMRAPWAGVARHDRRGSSKSLIERLGGLSQELMDTARLGADVGRMLLGHGLKTAGLKPSQSPGLFTAPRSPFNVPITGARRFATASLPLSEIKQLGAAAGATVNDVLLAICAGALRNYLKAHKALPDKTLLANVPVSIRQINRPGNQITYVGARLCTDVAEPLKRLHGIGASTKEAKREVLEVSPAAAITFAVMAQGLVAVLNRFRLTDLLPPPANVVISNVPGPRKPLYFGGARLLVNYPLSVLVDGQALNITVISYCDSIDFGLMACRNAVPDLDRLAGMITEAYTELKRAIAAAPPRAKKKLRRKTLRQARGSRPGNRGS